MFSDLIKQYEFNMNARLGGKINAIPFGFKRFDDKFPGIIRGRYYGITASSGVSKTKLAKHLFVTNPHIYLDKNPHLGIEYKLFWFGMEESLSEFYSSLFANVHYRKTKDLGKGILVPTDMLYSYGTTLDKRVLDNLKAIRPEMEKIFRNMEVYDNHDTASSIYLRLLTYFIANGTFHLKDGTEVYPPSDIMKFGTFRFDLYRHNNPDAYVVIVVDHVGEMAKLPYHKTIGDTVDEVSKVLHYFAKKFSAVSLAIHQQMAEQEDLEHQKRKKGRPSMQGLGDSKKPGRAYHVLLGVSGFARYEVETHEGYNTKRLKDRARLLTVLKNRFGRSLIESMLYFYGEVDYFGEMPLVEDINDKIYDSIVLGEY